MKCVKIVSHYFIKYFLIFYSTEQFGLSIELSQPCVNNRIRSLKLIKILVTTFHKIFRLDFGAGQNEGKNKQSKV